MLTDIYAAVLQLTPDEEVLALAEQFDKDIRSSLEEQAHTVHTWELRLVQARARREAENTRFGYEKWRHGGWYVHGVRYPNGAIGCVSRNYPDKKWRIVTGDQNATYRTREEAARAEYVRAAVIAHNEQQKP